MHRLAILCTHPIQYNAPWFAMLNREPGVQVRVFYTWSQRQHDSFDRAFGKEVRWDIPLLDGYDHLFVENVSSDPGSHHFRGIMCPMLIREVEDWGPSHLLVFGWNFSAHLKAMRHFRGRLPVLFRGDSTLLDPRSKLKATARRITLRWVYRHVDYALFTGTSNRRYFEASGLKEHQLVFAPHAVDNDRFRRDHNACLLEAGKMRAELGIGDDQQVILFAGKFEAVKDPFLLIEAYGLLTDRVEGSGAVLVFVGQGELEASMKEAARGNPGIHFLPFQNQSRMPVVFRLADILCLPSRSETWGLVVNEAMASGTRCLVSDRAGCAADLGTYPGNRIFRSGNPGHLSVMLAKMMQDTGFDNRAFLEDWSYPNLVRGVRQALDKKPPVT